MQQFQDDIMKNRLLIEKINKDLTEKIGELEATYLGTGK